MPAAETLADGAEDCAGKASLADIPERSGDEIEETVPEAILLPATAFLRGARLLPRRMSSAFRTRPFIADSTGVIDDDDDEPMTGETGMPGTNMVVTEGARRLSTRSCSSPVAGALLCCPSDLSRFRDSLILDELIGSQLASRNVYVNDT